MFALAALAFAVVPGPAVLYILAESIGGGRRAGVAAALGVATGGLVHVAASVAGLSALLVASAEVFRAVQLVGAAYLVWLGVRTLLGPDEAIGGRQPEATSSRAYGRGILVNVLNPKTALFILAFLPQFVDPDGPVRLQLAILGATLVLIALTTDLLWALAAGTARDLLRRNPTFLRVQRYVSGAIFVGLGVVAALSGSHRARA